MWAACVASVSGHILEGPNGVEGAKVVLTGAGPERQMVTSSSGRFLFPKLPAGEYRVKVQKQGYAVISGLPDSVKLAENGCVELTIRAEPDRRVYGRVYSADGKPVIGIPVALLRVRDLRMATEAAMIRAQSDSAGRFAFKNVPAGEYYMGVNLDRPESFSVPYARVFYPGTTEPEQARPIQIQEGGTIVEADLQLPPPESERSISGVVTWPDGKPAKDVIIYLEDPRFNWAVSTVQATTDENGLFTVKCYAGTRNRLHAVSACKEVPDCRSAEPVEIAPGVVPNLNLILSRPGHSGMEALKQAIEAAVGASQPR